jgi:hypothetical protein
MVRSLTCPPVVSSRTSVLVGGGCVLSWVEYTRAKRRLLYGYNSCQKEGLLDKEGASPRFYDRLQRPAPNRLRSGQAFRRRALVTEFILHASLRADSEQSDGPSLGMTFCEYYIWQALWAHIAHCNRE